MDSEYNKYVSGIKYQKGDLFITDGRKGILTIQPTPWTMFGKKNQRSKIITTPGAFDYFDIWADFLNTLKHETVHAKQEYNNPTTFIKRFSTFGIPFKEQSDVIKDELEAYEYQFINLNSSNTPYHIYEVGHQIKDLRQML